MTSRRSFRKYAQFHTLAPSKTGLKGFSFGFVMIVSCIMFVMGGVYLFSVNQSSVQGYAMRSLETEIQKLRKENGELRVREAEVRSLTRIESGSQILRMEKISSIDTLISNSFAFR